MTLSEMKMDGIDHVNITVSDLDKSQKFYYEVFGMEEAYRMPQFRFLKCGRSLLTLQEGDDRGTIGFHFGFQVGNNDELNKWKDWLKGNNVSLDNERVGEEGAGIYFHDPDGHALEIYFVKKW